jgi:hypothetical protein
MRAIGGVSLNIRRADLGLPQFDLPPADGWIDVPTVVRARVPTPAA